jgi:hypothetical protein
MTRQLVLMPILVLPLAMVACSQPIEARITARLEAAGLPQPMAQCMAKSWVKRLDIIQLRKIEHLSGDISREYKDRTLTVTGFIERVDRLDDPEIVRVVTTSAAVCALKI